MTQRRGVLKTTSAGAGLSALSAGASAACAAELKDPASENTVQDRCAVDAEGTWGPR